MLYLWILPPLYLGAVLYNTFTIVGPALHFTISLVVCWWCRLVAATVTITGCAAAVAAAAVAAAALVM